MKARPPSLVTMPWHQATAECPISSGATIPGAFSQGSSAGRVPHRFSHRTGADVASNDGKWIFQVDDRVFSMLTVDDAESDFIRLNHRDGATPSAVNCRTYIGLSAEAVSVGQGCSPVSNQAASHCLRPWGRCAGQILGVDVSGGTSMRWSPRHRGRDAPAPTRPRRHTCHPARRPCCPCARQPR